MKHLSRACGPLSLGILAAAQIVGPSAAQDALRGWNSERFDTDAYAVPAADVVAAFTTGAVLRIDGRIYVHGQTSLTDGPPAPPGTSYVQIALGAGHGFGLLTDGTIMAWSDAPVTLPAPALPANTSYTQVVGGASHVLARRSDGVAVAWGSNQYGQTSLPPVPAGIAVLQVHAGNTHSLLRLSNGTIVGCGDPTRIAVPPLPTGVVYTNFWGGRLHTIAVRSDGVAVGWGDNSAGQCNVPSLPPGVTYTTMGLGSYHTLAARSDGIVTGWGDNSVGQRNAPILAPGQTVAQIVCGQLCSTIRFGDGSVLGLGRTIWGGPILPAPSGQRWAAVAPNTALTSAGQIVHLGTGDAPPPPLPPGVTYTKIAYGYGHRVALRADGRAVAWGDNSLGQLAIPPLPPGMSYLEVDASFGMCLLLRSDGVVVTAGGTNPPLYVPPFGTEYVEIACHHQNILLRRSDGALITGDGTPSSLPAPPIGVRYVQIAAMRTFSAALRSDGEVAFDSASAANVMPPLPSGVVYVQIGGFEDVFVARRSDGRIVSITNIGTVTTPLPGPGESFVEVEPSIGRIGPTRTYLRFANGCAGTLPASRLVPRNTPHIGGSLEVGVFDLPHDLAWMVFGLSQVPPVSLAAIGMPGCDQHISLDGVTLLVGENGSARHLLPIPNTLSLLGVHFHHQAIVFDVAANPAGLVVSDAAEAIIGHP